MVVAAYMSLIRKLSHAQGQAAELTCWSRGEQMRSGGSPPL